MLTAPVPIAIAQRSSVGIVEGDLLHDAGAEGQAREGHGRLADRLDQLGGVTCEVLQRPGQRQVAAVVPTPRPSKVVLRKKC